MDRIIINRHHTGLAMMKLATHITGETFKRRDYEGAAKALRKWARQREAEQRKAIEDRVSVITGIRKYTCGVEVMVTKSGWICLYPFDGDKRLEETAL